MALLSSLVWLFVGYCMFAYKYGEGKLGRSITQTAGIFFGIPAAFLLFGALMMFSDHLTQYRVVSTIIIIVADAFLFGRTIIGIEGVKDGGIVAGVAAQLATFYYFSMESCIYWFFDRNELLGYMLFFICELFLPFIVLLSVIYLITRFRVRREKKLKQETE